MIGLTSRYILQVRRRHRRYLPHLRVRPKLRHVQALPTCARVSNHAAAAHDSVAQEAGLRPARRPPRRAQRLPHRLLHLLLLLHSRNDLLPGQAARVLRLLWPLNVHLLDDAHLRQRLRHQPDAFPAVRELRQRSVRGPLLHLLPGHTSNRRELERTRLPHAGRRGRE